MYQKARDSSVPLDTIERAIKRGTGELEGVQYEAHSYEGYAPGGVAVYVEVLTDNRNRASSEVRSIFTKNGGSLAEPGAVAWQFERMGVIHVPASADEDEVMGVGLDAGLDDLVPEGDSLRLTCDPSDLTVAARGARGGGRHHRVGRRVDDPRVRPCPLEADDAKSVLRLLDDLDDHDDVQGVHANFDIADEVMEASLADGGRRWLWRSTSAS